MFDLTNKKMEEKDVESKARDMFADMMVKAILTSESTPEHIKLSTSIIVKVRDNDKALHEIIEKYCTSGNVANIETLKKIKEYLELVEVGIKQFIETTPFIKHSEEQ